MALKIAHGFRTFTWTAAILLLVAITDAAPAETTSLQVRGTVQVSEYFDQKELIKRVNLLLFTAVLEGFGKVAATACAADIEPATKAAICAITVVGTVAALLFGAYKAFSTRQETDIRAPSMMIDMVPQIHGQSRSKTLMDHYTGLPIMMGYNDCFGPGCYQVHYQNRISAEGRLLHHVTVHPRHNETTLAKRQDEQESGSDANMDLYGDYVYHDMDKGVEGQVSDTYDQQSFADLLEHDVDNDEWTNTGIHCFNIYNGAASDNDPTSEGFFSLNNDTPFQDPDNEDSYISQCIAKGL